MLNEKLIEILRCPNCVQENEGLLEFYKDAWFVCEVCDRKYPVVKEIPVMLLDEGDKWVSTVKADLPIPPPDFSQE